MINFAPFISMLLTKKKTSSKPRKLSKNAKREIQKIDEMGLFSAIDYLKNK